MSDEERADETASDDEVVAVLREIRDLQKEMLARQKAHLWILLPIFALLAMMLILGLAGFF